MTATKKIIKMPRVVTDIGASFKDLYQQFSSLGQKLSILTFAQYLYLFAFLLAIFSDSFSWVAAITVLALAIELLPLFERIWHSLMGKALLLLFYAVVANFALSWAGGVVNDVIGVSATHFAYTHNLAILLYIPVWFVFITALVILAAQLLVPFYFVLFIFLKPIGIALPQLTQNAHFQKTTWLLRLMLATGLLVHLVLYIVPELDGQALKRNLTSDISVGVEQPLITVNTDVGTAEQEFQDEYLQTRYKYQSFVRQMIALFAFEFEADSKSRCQKSVDSRVVELNDYEIMEIYQDEAQQDGFRFEVKKCISPAFPADS
ncbi:hypothetical protein L2747_14490 [Shewanella marinintestina]|uniref:hypothetical protein n=1 Tax=Shewanella marinintestina TaxID=190305 RepID=UPI00200D5B67|nr:hypothetical protein [Shewanella marinintestina]MCL1147211.1 hypothetical protein [Shewanella marinintestina]